MHYYYYHHHHHYIAESIDKNMDNERNADSFFAWNFDISTDTLRRSETKLHYWHRLLFCRGRITAFRRIFSNGCSWWWIRPPGWCSPRSGFVNFAGWRPWRSGSTSYSLSSCTNVCTGQNRRTSPTSCTSPPTPRPDSVFALRRRHLWLSVVRVCQVLNPSVIEVSRSLFRANGTLCYITSLPTVLSAIA